MKVPGNLFCTRAGTGRDASWCRLPRGSEATYLPCKGMRLTWAHTFVRQTYHLRCIVSPYFACRGAPLTPLAFVELVPERLGHLSYDIGQWHEQHALTFCREERPAVQRRAGHPGVRGQAAPGWRTPAGEVSVPTGRQWLQEPHRTRPLAKQVTQWTLSSSPCGVFQLPFISNERPQQRKNSRKREDCPGSYLKREPLANIYRPRDWR